MISLRERLRSGTRQAHDATDTAFARFDLTKPAGLLGFLSAHRDAFASMRAVAKPGLETSLDHALDCLTADLAVLGTTEKPTVRNGPAVDEVFAQKYLWLGSRLGTRMLARKWESGQDETARAAGRYLTETTTDRTAWRTLCDELEAMPGYGAEAERILAASNDWFALFETTCHDHVRRGYAHV
ncbi:MAG: hypothetical protein AAF919_01330 [Pseudomonadota bacterium]